MVECNDKKCFIHGDVSVHKGRLIGEVVSNKPKHTVIVEIELVRKVKKYQRLRKKKSHIPAHNPPCINAKVGDKVLLGETRKLSKTKAWTVMKVLNQEEGGVEQ